MLRAHEIVYWFLMILCLVPAGVCLEGAMRNVQFAEQVADATAYLKAARYWAYGSVGFVAIGAGFGLNAALIHRKRRRSSPNVG